MPQIHKKKVIMKYISVNEETKLDMSFAVLKKAYPDGNDLVLIVGNAIATEELSCNDTGGAAFIPEMEMILRDGCLLNAYSCRRKQLSLKNNAPKDIPEHTLYKSELPEFMERISSEEADIFAFSRENGMLTLEINFDDGVQLYRAEFSADEITAQWDEFGRKYIPKKLTLTERAAMLKRDIPALVMAVGHKDTPAFAKILCAAAVCYALSPIDLVPDFIPFIGYLDDIIILPGLIYMAFRLIPDEVLEECREKADRMYDSMPKSKWYYGIPTIIIWVIVLVLIISALLK